MIELYTFLEFNIWMILMYALYSVIRNMLTHSIKRIVLLSVPFLAFGTLFLKQMLLDAQQSVTIPLIELDAITVDGTATTAQQFNFSWQDAYFIGFGLMILFLLYKLIRLSSLFKGAEKLPGKNVYLATSDHKNSFSFFNRIHLTVGLDEAEKEVVLEHEMHHLHKMHSLDVILMELFHALFWFNPVFFWVKKEIVQVHEFEVDEAMYKKHKATYLEVLLARTMDASSSQILLTSQFYNKLTLAKRFKIMRTHKKHKNAWVFIVPLLAGSMALFSWTYEYQFRAEMNGDISYQEEKVHETLKNPPQFKGGNEALFEYMSKNVKYPEEAQKNKVEGTVFVGFIVNKDGSLTNIHIKRGVNEAIDNSALKAIKGMPNWVPGEKDGKPVRAQMVLPIKFKL